MTKLSTVMTANARYFTSQPKKIPIVTNYGGDSCPVCGGADVDVYSTDSELE